MGNIFVKQFYRMLKGKSSAIVHGACIGVGGKGALLCARGGKGKSTLAVSALIKGFEYVADDYLIIDSKQNQLVASPIYSIVKLSHIMYEEMKGDLGGAKIIFDNSQMDKYVISISRWHNQFRNYYPIRLCLLPEIVPELEIPSIIRCSREEKGQGIIRMVHSTVSQLMDKDSSGSLKLIKMLQDQDFYRIRLCPDIFKNVEYLRGFLEGYKN